MDEMVSALLNGNRRALARFLTWVENGDDGIDGLLAQLYPHTGRAWVIGVTGAPGTGKSSLVSALARACRQDGQTVGILAVDPTSPFTGGAILGDRIRMRDLSGDPGVFIRSMATRGSLGGLARTTRDAARVLDAAGFSIILIETVGAGQSEVEIARAAHTTLVVEAPGLGDDVQAIKAGILEIADVLVVNKADRPGAVNTVRALRAMLELGHPSARGALMRHHGQLMTVDPPPAATRADLWIPPVVQTVAVSDSGEAGRGIDDLLAAIDQHRAYLAEADHRAALERQQIEIELYDRLRAALLTRLLDTLPPAAFDAAITRVQARELDPASAVKALLATRLNAL